jgi:peroxiredoxin
MGSNKIDNVLRVGIGVLLLAFMWVVADVFRERIVVVGDAAPEFSIVTDNGKTVTPAEFGGKLLVLNFWATWCPPCVEEMPSLEQFHKTFSPKGVVVLGISVDKDQQVYQQFLKQAGVTFLTARDNGKRINLEYGTVKFPETYIIGSNGKVLSKIIAGQNWMEPNVIRYVESLL